MKRRKKEKVINFKYFNIKYLKYLNLYHKRQPKNAIISIGLLSIVVELLWKVIMNFNYNLII